MVKSTFKQFLAKFGPEYHDEQSDHWLTEMLSTSEGGIT